MTHTVLITGASTGIGKAAAKHFASQGRNVVATMRSPEKETELTNYDNILVTSLDVTKQESIDNALQAGIEKFGRIDVLVNNAGYGLMGPVEAISVEQFQRQYDVNVTGIFRTTKAILPHMRANGGGRIINISSIGGLISMPSGAPYMSTKWAVEGFTESMVYEVAPHNIKMKLVEPGAIKTEFMSRGLDMPETIPQAYASIMEKITAAFGAVMESGSDAQVVADVIYEAATDEGERIRYLAGEDAKQMEQQRKSGTDTDRIKGMNTMFGL